MYGTVFERLHCDDACVEGSVEALIGMAHDVLRVRKSSAGVCCADTDAHNDRYVTFGGLEGVHV